ncbi:MAG: ComF family protein [Planctomycetes bacterium]|nr:ComF family protein [Planctomycetota bacterium]
MLHLEPAPIDARAEAPPDRWTWLAADALFPARCALCGADDADAGVGCAEHALHGVLPGPRCGRCARALPPSLPDADLCRVCRAEPPAFERVVVLSDYGADRALRAWILAFKHGGRRDLASVLGALLAARLVEERSARPTGRRGLLVPVPLHPRRRFERGYDQARLLAEAAGGAAEVPVRRALRRVRSTPIQGAPLSPPRAENVRRAFAPARGACAPPGKRSTWFARVVATVATRCSGARGVAGSEVWLVDDVVTSGATANACAAVLLGLGAASVGVLALARARGAREREVRAGEAPEPEPHESGAHEPGAHDPDAHEPSAREPDAREPDAREPDAHEPSTHAREREGRVEDARAEDVLDADAQVRDALGRG